MASLSHRHAGLAVGKPGGARVDFLAVAASTSTTQPTIRCSPARRRSPRRAFAASLMSVLPRTARRLAGRQRRNGKPARSGDRKTGAAAAGGDRVGIVDLEALADQVVDIVDLGAAHEFEAAANRSAPSHRPWPAPGRRPPAFPARACIRTGSPSSRRRPPTMRSTVPSRAAWPGCGRCACAARSVKTTSLDARAASVMRMPSGRGSGALVPQSNIV